MNYGEETNHAAGRDDAQHEHRLESRDLRMRTTEIVRLLPFVVLLMLTPARAQATDPECSGVEGWFTRMAHVHLKNAGLITNDAIDFTKTKTVRLASEKIGDNLYRPVHHVTFTEKSGATIQAITIGDASSEECSMTGVKVFVVSRTRGP